MKKAFIFLPETQVYYYAYTFGIFGNALKKNGYEVYISDCNQLVYRCPIMLMNNIKSRNDSCMGDRCQYCKNNIKKLTRRYDFTPCDLSKYVTDIEREEIFKLCDGKVSANWNKIEYEGYHVGQIAIGDLMREKKVLGISELSKDEEDVYQQYIITMSLIICAFKKIVSDIQPDIVMAFNPYVQNQAVHLVCDRLGIKFKYFSNEDNQGSDYSLFTITDKFSLKERIDHNQNFASVRDLALNYNQTLQCYEDAAYKGFFYGSHIFSAKKTNNTDELLEKLGLDINKKTICAFTSSYDEPLGNEIYFREWNLKDNSVSLFNIQYDWLHYLVDYARRHDDIQIIVRIHPREAQTGQSYHVKFLKSKLILLPDNYRIIWPEENISSYDLFDICDLCLVNNSTMAMECHRQAIPVVGYVQNFLYPNEGYFLEAKSILEYESALNSYLYEGKKTTIEDLKKSTRFFYWRTFSFNVILKNYVKSGLPVGGYPKLSRKVNKSLCLFLEDKITKDVLNGVLYKQSETGKDEVDAIKDGIKKLFCINVYTLLGLPLIKERSKFSHFLFRIVRKIIWLLTCRKISIIEKTPKSVDFSDFVISNKNEGKSFCNRKRFITYTKNGFTIKFFYQNKSDVLLSKTWARLLEIYEEN